MLSLLFHGESHATIQGELGASYSSLWNDLFILQVFDPAWKCGHPRGAPRHISQL